MCLHDGGWVCQVSGEHDPFQLEGIVTNGANVCSLKTQGSGEFLQWMCCHFAGVSRCVVIYSSQISAPPQDWKQDELEIAMKI